jgi:hypothetical protein
LGYSLRDIAEELGAHVHGDENCRIDRVAALADAEPAVSASWLIVVFGPSFSAPVRLTATSVCAKSTSW